MKRALALVLLSLVLALPSLSFAAPNDFWRRAAGLPSDPPSENDAQERIGTELLGAILMDLAIGSGGYTVAQARVSMNLEPGSDADTEFTDLINSATSITNANAITRRLLRGQFADGVRAALALAEQNNAFPSNIYMNPEQVRQRVRAIVLALGGTPTGTLSAP